MTSIPQNRFYIVVNGRRGPAPKPVTHSTYQAAKKEAERIARLEPGAPVFVLAAVAKLTRRDVDFEALEPHPHDISAPEAHPDDFAELPS